MFRFRLKLAALAALTLGLTVSSASAQNGSITLNQFEASETPEDGFAVSRPDDLGHLRIGAHLHLDYSNDPLVYEAAQGDRDSEDRDIVGHQLSARVGLSIGLFDRLVIFAGLPFDLVQKGDDVGTLGLPAAGGAGLGDIYLGARVRILGERADTFALGAQLSGTFPSGSGAYGGDDFLSLHPELLAEVRASIVRITLNAGARIRENQTFGAGDQAVEVGDTLTYALGVTATIWGDYAAPATSRLDLHVQGFGNTSFSNAFGREESPFEVLGGAKFHHANGLVAGLAAGFGVTRGFGNPDNRIMLTVGWATPAEVEGEAPRRRGDRDGDGIMDDDDQCPDEPEDVDTFEDENGCPDPDNDGDSILDVDDECPLEPEDMDRFEDENGCPDPDNDQDGILDTSDECPDQPEDMDQFEDENGCPDPDNDEDGILDGADRCPNEPGPVANNGCPDSDRDGDTVVDRLDNCPDEAGTVANQGCRRRQQVVIREGQLEILDRVYFRTNSDQILRRSNRLLNNVADVINNHPEITMIRVEGHTDDRGDDDYNLDLSRRRAASVVAYLVRRDVDAGRLQARGFGEVNPIETNDTREGRAANRRVEFNLGDQTTVETRDVGPDASTIDS